MAGIRKRNRLQGPPPAWSEVLRCLHMRVKDAAAELNIPIGCLRRLCRQNGFRTWPGKRIRSMKSLWENMQPLQVDAPEGSSRAGLPVPSLLAMIAEMEKEKDEEEDMTRIQAAPVANLTTLNLIDKVGLSSTSTSEHT